MCAVVNHYYERSHGSVENATEETTTSASYADLTSPDVVENIVLPDDGLIFLAYRSRIKCPGGGGVGYAAIHLNSTQIKIPASTDAALRNQEDGASTGYYYPMTSEGYGLKTVLEIPGVDTADPSGTGTIIGGRYNTGSTYGHHGGLTIIEADAGTYDIGIKYKVTGGATFYVKSRKLWVFAEAYS